MSNNVDILPHRGNNVEAVVDEKGDAAYQHQEGGGDDIANLASTDKAGLSVNQQTLIENAIREKSKGLGTFTAIKYYWVAFWWAQFAAFGTILTGYDGTVSRARSSARGSASELDVL